MYTYSVKISCKCYCNVNVPTYVSKTQFHISDFRDPRLRPDDSSDIRLDFSKWAHSRTHAKLKWLIPVLKADNRTDLQIQTRIIVGESPERALLSNRFFITSPSPLALKFNFASFILDFKVLKKLVPTVTQMEKQNLCSLWFFDKEHNNVEKKAKRRDNGHSTRIRFPLIINSLSKSRSMSFHFSPYFILNFGDIILYCRD